MFSRNPAGRCQRGVPPFQHGTLRRMHVVLRQLPLTRRPYRLLHRFVLNAYGYLASSLAPLAISKVVEVPRFCTTRVCTRNVAVVAPRSLLRRE